MAKLEVSDDQLKKFMDDATKDLVKDLEKQVKSLETRLRGRDVKIANLQAQLSARDEHSRILREIHSMVNEFCEEAY